MIDDGPQTPEQAVRDYGECCGTCKQWCPWTAVCRVDGRSYRDDTPRCAHWEIYDADESLHFVEGEK